jgi:hypothetical protein
MLRGQMRGEGSLDRGDSVVAGGLLLEVLLVLDIDTSRNGRDVVIVLDAGLPLEGCQGTTVTFRGRPPVGALALTADGRVVPSHVNVLVGYSASRLTMGVRFGVLLFEGPRVSLVGEHTLALLEGTGPDLAVATVGGTRLCLTSRTGVSVDVVGPEAEWSRRSAAAALIQRYRAVVVPDADLDALSRWAGRSAVEAEATNDARRQQVVWRGVLLTMLTARGVRLA